MRNPALAKEVGSSKPSEPSTSQFSPRQLIPNLISGLFIWGSGFITILSLTTLIFGGRLAPHLGNGIGLALVSAMIISLVIALTSSYPGMIGNVQNSAMVLAALVVANAVNALPPDASPETVLYNGVAVIGLTTLVTGGVFLMIGMLRASDLIRYIPYPVMGGFLAGTGWLLMQGALDVMTGEMLSLYNLDVYLQSDMLIKWLPGFGLALLLLGLARTFRRSWPIPLTVVTYCLLFFAFLLVMDISLAEAAQRGLLLDQGNEPIVWQPPNLAMLTTVDWSFITTQAGGIMVVALVSSISLLLNASVIEFTTRHDIELDRELRSAGAANLITGALGGMIGFSSLSLTTLAHRLGTRSRITGVWIALLYGLVLVVGIPALGLLPRSALGGLLMYLSLSFLIEWLWDTRTQLPLSDYLVTIAIFLVIIFVGFLEGVALGIAAMILLFVVNYSRINIARNQLSGTVYHSNVDRSPVASGILRQEGDRIWVLRLQGYIFFGTSNDLINVIRSRLDASGLPPLRHLVLDFSLVNGVDTSAVMDFVKLGQIAQTNGFTVVFTNLNAEYDARFRRSGLAEGDHVRRFDDLDHGMEWCENDLLSHVKLMEHFSLESQFESRAIHRAFDITQLLGYLKRVEMQTGDYIMREGDESGSIYILESGRVDIVVQGQDGRDIRLRSISAGAIVGEIGFYLGQPRTASVIVDKPGTLYELTRDALSRMERNDPQIASAFQTLITCVLSERLTNMNRLTKALMN